tara:strand:+ start:13847 stop:14056 length:210 start_codon:yes stop_codon:yes gene_type:complete
MMAKKQKKVEEKAVELTALQEQILAADTQAKRQAAAHAARDAGFEHVANYLLHYDSTQPSLSHLARAAV